MKALSKKIADAVAAAAQCGIKIELILPDDGDDASLPRAIARHKDQVGTGFSFNVGRAIECALDALAKKEAGTILQ